MTEQVLISIKGMQMVGEDADTSPELITTGTYHCINEVHQVLFEELMEDMEVPIHNELLFGDDKVEIKKEGDIQTHMVFEKDKKNLSFYQTPYGSISIAMTATQVEILNQPEEINIHLDYGLEMNEQHVADCSIQIAIHAQTA